VTANGYTGGSVSIADIAGLQANLDALADRSLTSGETVIRRGDIITSSLVDSGTLFVTHFQAQKSESITKFHTATGGSTAVAVGGTHAWVGVLAWDGTNYTPLVQSADTPSLWSAQFTSYDTPLTSTFAKVKGTQYAAFMLWIGSGQVPSLPAGGGWYADSLTAPRTNGVLFGQTAPPSGSLPGSFFGPDSRRFQGVMLP
jgi:hypothetical protein